MKPQVKSTARAPWASVAVGVFVLAALAGGVAFGAAVLDGEHRADTALAAMLQPDYTGDSLTAPDFTLTDPHGRRVTLSSLRGKTVVLHFWSRDCPPCIQELSEPLPAFGETLRGRSDIVLVLVGVEPWQEVSPLIPRSLNATLLFDPTRSVVEQRFGTRLFPETWIIDPNGVIRARFDRTLDWTSAALLRYIESFR